MDEILATKIVAMAVLAMASFTMGLLPWKLCKYVQISNGKPDEKNLTLSLLLCFGGGVLLYTTFLHLQPEVRESFDTLHIDFLKHLHISVSDLIFCLGFFFVYLIEEIAHVFIINHDDHDDNQDVILRRSLSIRGPRNVNSFRNSKQLPKITNNNNNNNSNSNNDFAKSYETPDSFTKSMKHSVTSLLVVIALCFHAIFEGLAVGLENSVRKVGYLFIAITTHKLVIAFCIGVELVSSKTKFSLILLYLSIFALVTPLGIGFGIILSDSGKSAENLTAVILQGMAAGTLLYVVFFEVLAREKSNKHCGIWQFLAIILGFSTMFCLQILTVHEHSHGPSHDNHGLELTTKIVFNSTTIR